MTEPECEVKYCVKSQTEVILAMIGMCQSLLHERVIWPDLYFRKNTLVPLWRVEWREIFEARRLLEVVQAKVIRTPN